MIWWSKAMTTIPNAAELEILAAKSRVAELAAKLTWLTPFQAACYMGIGESTLWRLLHEGAISSSKVVGIVRITRADCDMYLNRGKRGGTGSDPLNFKTEFSPAQPRLQNVS